ncbi:MAG: aminoacyl-tRNA hydrolase [Candidatus Omnitrophica bacterium]|nr:aminoacyl-tRNA hydrolase [Candidatus Omnitrophota bacterium]
MKLIVGLGNPGLEYSNSRHNIGFTTVKALGRIYQVALKKDLYTKALTAKVRIKNQTLILALPLTYMNYSGRAVGDLVKRYKMDLKNLLVVCDDLDLDFGRIRIRPKGSSGGHRGLTSIIESLKTQEFPRLRIGIGRPPYGMDAAKYVLSAFSKEEKKKIKRVINKATACCQVWLNKGIDECMNIFNRGSESSFLSAEEEKEEE